MTRLYRLLLLAATLLAFGVIALGAYVRLSDAGLGCPDWPGCYGHLLGVPAAEHEQSAARQAFPARPLDTGKAWKEMLHRYFAGSLGLLILAICLLAWRRELRARQSPFLPTLLLGIVGLQAALGMWTVTLLLKPVIVTLHLLGGMSTLAMLLALTLRQAPPPGPGVDGLRLPAALALFAVVGQIALGGWVSSNYAALACNEFPLCSSNPALAMDFTHAFSLHRELGYTADGQLLSQAALAAIHWSHRLGAAVVTLSVASLGLALLLRRAAPWSALGGGVLGLLALQLGLGIANVLLSLPLPLAVAHNLGAAALLAATLAINLRLYPTTAGQRRFTPPPVAAG